MISRSQISKVLSVYRVEKPPRVAQSPKIPGETGEDKVNLSFDPGDLQRVRDIVRRLPDVRIGKADDIAGRLSAGTYRVDSEEVAEKILGRLLADKIR